MYIYVYTYIYIYIERERERERKREKERERESGCILLALNTSQMIADLVNYPSIQQKKNQQGYK